MLGAEVAGGLALPEPGWSWVWLGSALHVLCFALVCLHCLTHRRQPTSSLLWMFLAWAFPGVGALLYLVVGVDRATFKGLLKHATDRRLLAERKAREEETLPLAYWRAVHEAGRGVPAGAPARELDAALQAILPEHPLLGGNSIAPLVTGDEAYPPMLAALRGARHHIHLQSFIIRDDRVGREFLHALAGQARAGVTVRVLYDRFGSTHAGLTGLFRRHRRVPNLQIAGWTQANPFKRQFQVNLRNHRKVLVVDGRVAFFGGINLHADNVTHPAREPIRDYHFAVRGPAVQELQYAFMNDWFFMTGEEPRELLREAYFPHLEPAGSALIRLVNSGPTREMETNTDVFFLSILAARRQVLAVTPYFVPPPDIVRALRAAAWRGVDVRLLVPRDNNHFYAGLAGRALYEELLNAGVRVFERRPPFIHAKALIVDDQFALVGTANLDARSLQLNYETNAAVYDEDFANRLKEIVLEDFAAGDEIRLAEWQRRPAGRRLLENVAFLLQPVL